MVYFLLEDRFLARWNPIMKMLLHCFHKIFLSDAHKRERCSFVVASSRSTDSVDVGINVVWKIEIDNIRNELKVNASYYSRFLVLFSLTL